ncbi:hypothetical protein DFP72DRAFT_345684 [Ephemerocybe angulata]|uniref:Uncharacterized protein n=1 Tax=Ephemerocybe angulata TaxID=980116 RepID=A0A8H6LTY3_9AGAR|nr:hypothetical protein DFP72DRAFT_345684 [Tulosesus angulatus]
MVRKFFYEGEAIKQVDTNSVFWIDKAQLLGGDNMVQELADNGTRSNLVFHLYDDEEPTTLYMVRHVLPYWGVARYIGDIGRNCRRQGYSSIVKISWCPRFVDTLFINAKNVNDIDKALGPGAKDAMTIVPNDTFTLLDYCEHLNYPDRSVGCWLDVYVRELDFHGSQRVYRATGFVTAPGPEGSEDFEVTFIAALKNDAIPRVLTLEDINAHFGEGRVEHSMDAQGNVTALVYPIVGQVRIFWNGLERKMVNVKEVCEPMDGIEGINLDAFA